MIIVWVTMLIGLGVMFGMASLVSDLGLGMVQVRAMQNGADAGVMASARLLASSVAGDGAGGVVFVMANGVVHDKAEEFASYNRPVNMAQDHVSHLLALLRPSVADAQTGATTMTVVCDPNPTAPGSPTSCRAQLDSGTNPAPTGTVTFSDSSGTGTFSPATCTLSPQGPAGRARCSVTYTPTQLGTETITASYSGDAVYAPNSRTTSLSVAPPTPTPTPGPTSTPEPTSTPAPTSTPPVPPRATYPIALQYLPCPGSSAPARNFTAESDLDLVLEVNLALTGTAVDTRQGSPSDLVPPPPSVCALRLFTRVIHPSAFASAIGASDMTETARATARILPAPPPTEFSNTWPITRWVCNGSDDEAGNEDENGDGCDEEAEACSFGGPPGSPPPLCTFWDSHSDPPGDFKDIVDLSRYSEVHGGVAGGIEQHLSGWPGGTDVGEYPVDYDDSCVGCWATYGSPGNNGPNDDLSEWTGRGWRGTFRVFEADPACWDPDLVLTECHGSRVETYQGDHGSNVAGNPNCTPKRGMRCYVNTYTEFVDPVLGKASTVVVFLYRFGEENIVTDPLSPAFDTGTLWTGGNANFVERLILVRARRFRFFESTIASSSVEGYYVGFVSEDPPTCDCPPSPVANTVVLVE